jgi:hypothetical protein
LRGKTGHYQTKARAPTGISLLCPQAFQVHRGAVASEEREVPTGVVRSESARAGSGILTGVAEIERASA